MIEVMKLATIATSSNKDYFLLTKLRDLGLLHIKGLVEKSESSDSIASKSSEIMTILSNIIETKVKKKKYEALEIENHDEFFANAKSLISRRKSTEDAIFKLTNEIANLSGWGDYNPHDFEFLKSQGLDITIYSISDKEFAKLKDENLVNYIVLKQGKNESIIALVQDKITSVFAKELVHPEFSLSELKTQLHLANEDNLKIAKELENLAHYEKSINDYLTDLGNDLAFSKVNASLIMDSNISLIQGYIPESQLDEFRSFAKENSFAYSIKDLEEDDNPPTKIKHRGLVRILQPVYDLLGIVPGYKEYDISLYFLVYFSVFFAMIIGDAGYGVIFLALAVVMNLKSEKISDLNILLYVLSTVTIVWGAVTGTWFGSEFLIAKIPFLRMFVIESVTNYPDLFNVDSLFTQNTVMKFCFILGFSQLALACVLNVIIKSRAKDLSFIADIGWLIDVVVLYFLVLFLVIGETVNFTPIIIGVAVGFVLIIVFGSQSPGTTFKQGLLAGFADSFTTFLNTISCFSNIMSYIRLFAVGMASLAIAQSFNDMASGMLSSLAFPVGIAILLLGHGLNLVMGLLSVVVHGVRLNLLEFSGQLSMEWAGYNYEPFKKNGNK